MTLRAEKMSDLSDTEEDELLKEEFQPIVPTRSFPKIIALLVVAAAITKIAFYLVPWLIIPKGPPTPLHIHPGEGFAVGSHDTETPHASTATTIRTTSTTPATVTFPTKTSTAWSYQRYKTENFTAPNLTISKSGDTAPGLLFIGIRGSGCKSQAPMIMTEDGELIWHGPEAVSTNVMLQQINGTSHITYWQGLNAAAFGRGYGAVHVLNSSYDSVAIICPHDMDIVPDAAGVRLDCFLDMHESFVTPNGTLVVTGYNLTQHDLSSIGGPEDGWIFNSMFYEIDIQTQEILHHWKSLDHLDQIPINQTKQPIFVDGVTLGSSPGKAFDYFHINSVQPLSDGYLINGRHTWSVYKLSRSGSVEWRLQGDHGGDFLVDPNLAFSWQHDVRAVHTTSSTMRLNIFSNSNSEVQSEIKDSKGLEIFLDLEHFQALLLRHLEDPEDLRHSFAMGSWQNLANDHVLIGYGKDGTVKEFDHLNQCIYTASFRNATGGSAEIASYRAYKFDWSAQPSAPPKLVAEYDKEDNMTRLYASWNGATEDIFDNWIIDSGDLAGSLHSHDRPYKRHGFETAMELEGKSRFYQVTAMMGLGIVQSSEAVELEWDAKQR